MVYRINGNLDNVRFAKIKDFDDYLIRGNGDVYSLKYKKPRKLKQTLNKNRGNYYQVGLCSNNKRKTCYVHRLVAEAFIPNPYGFDTIDHIDCDTTNNKINNLQYLSRGDNTRKAMLRKYHGKPLQDISEVQ